MDNLPPEICVKIVHYVGFVSDLLSLCRVCKAFQRAAQAKLFESVILRDPQTTYIACQSINAKNGRLGAFVRRFWMFQDHRRMRDIRSPIPRYVWEEIHNALKNMINLESLHIQDPTASNSWIIAPPSLEFQLLEATIGFAWDANVVAFLQTQNRLRFLHSLDSTEDGPPCPVPSDALQSLQSYNGSILVANELCRSPLVHLQVMLDEESAPLMLHVLSDLGNTRKNLRSLSILYMPEDMVLETLQLVSKSAFATSLRYLGLLPLPILDVGALFFREPGTSHKKKFSATMLSVASFSALPLKSCTPIFRIGIRSLQMYFNGCSPPR